MTGAWLRYWAAANARFAGRKPRERTLALAIALALVLVLGDRLLLRPVQARYATLAAREQMLRAPDPALAAAQRAVEAQAQERQRLGEDLAQVDRDLAELTARIVPAQQMKPLLDRVIAGLPGLRLVELRNLPAQPVRPAPAGSTAPVEGQVYRHGFEVTVEGSYAELVLYLERLEGLPQQLYWRRAELDASHYPKERLVFEIYTLSREPTWLIL